MALKNSVYVYRRNTNTPVPLVREPPSVYRLCVIPLGTWEKVHASTKIHLLSIDKVALIKSKNTFGFMVNNYSCITTYQILDKKLATVLVFIAADWGFILIRVPPGKSHGQLSHSADLLRTQSF